MLTLSRRHQLAVGALLAVAMAATRSHHFPTIDNMIPDASWAIFFLAGVYVRPAWTLAVLLGEAALIDAIAIGWAGVSDYCVSPAYIALIPAYASLWFAGRWYAGRHRFAVATLASLAGSAFVGAAACELISSGSFYFFSDRFAATNLAEFATRLAKYAPHDLLSVAFWVGIAALVHAAAVTARGHLVRAA